MYVWVGKRHLLPQGCTQLSCGKLTVANCTVLRMADTLGCQEAVHGWHRPWALLLLSTCALVFAWCALVHACGPANSGLAHEASVVHGAAVLDRTHGTVLGQAVMQCVFGQACQAWPRRTGCFGAALMCRAAAATDAISSPLPDRQSLL